MEKGADELIAAANDYVVVARDNFFLEPIFPIDGMEPTEAERYFQDILNKSSPIHNEAHHLFVQFLFPNLMQFERDELARCRFTGEINPNTGTRLSPESFNERVANLRASQKEWDRKLTAVQLEILDKVFLSWDGRGVVR
jgi:hypothetical protein